MTQNSHLSSHLRRQPKQKRSRERVAKILEAAAAVFDEVGYEAATTHQIAAKAGTAVGSIYQFFPDKAAIFHEMELRHIEQVKNFWAKIDIPKIVNLPLREMIHLLVVATTQLFENPVSRVVFIQFYTSRDIFSSIDESMTQEAIDFLANILKQKNSCLKEEKCCLLAEVCIHSSNAIILASLRQSSQKQSQQLMQEIENLLVSYLDPYLDF